MLRIGKVEVTASFLLLVTLLLYFDGQSILLWSALAAFFHELGHAASLHFMGAHVGRLRLTACGAVLFPQSKRTLSYAQQIGAAAAGPAVSLLLVGLALTAAPHWTELYLLAGISGALGLFNLLPILPLDGGKIALALLSCAVERDCAERVVWCVSMICAGVLFVGGSVLLLSHAGHSPALALIATWLGVGNLKRKDL